MRRQVGADHVDIDTRACYARYWHDAPARIDFDGAHEAIVDSGYTLKGISLEIEGVVEQTACVACGHDVATLRVPATGQRFELEAEPDVATGEELHLRAEVLGWDGEHPRLRPGGDWPD